MIKQLRRQTLPGLLMFLPSLFAAAETPQLPRCFGLLASVLERTGVKISDIPGAVLEADVRFLEQLVLQSVETKVKVDWPKTLDSALLSSESLTTIVEEGFFRALEHSKNLRVFQSWTFGEFRPEFHARLLDWISDYLYAQAKEDPKKAVHLQKHLGIYENNLLFLGSSIKRPLLFPNEGHQSFAKQKLLLHIKQRYPGVSLLGSHVHTPYLEDFRLALQSEAVDVAVAWLKKNKSQNVKELLPIKKAFPSTPDRIVGAGHYKFDGKHADSTVFESEEDFFEAVSARVGF